MCADLLPVAGAVISKFSKSLSVQEGNLVKQYLLTPCHSVTDPMVISKRTVEVEAYPALHSMIMDIGHLSTLHVAGALDITPSDSFGIFRAWGGGKTTVDTLVVGLIVLSMLGTILLPLPFKGGSQ